MTHLVSIRDLTREEVFRIFRLAAELKAKQKAGDRTAPLAGRTMALVFEKPSLRTRVTFEVGMVHLGGRAIYLSTQEIGLGVRESVPDVARNLGRWVDLIAARTFPHGTVESLARHAGIPVINGLSDLEHPCQALADFFTLWELGWDLAKIRLAWIGDGNNVCHSIMLLAALMGTSLVVAGPPGYEPKPEIQVACRELGGRFAVTVEPQEAARDADALYTDVWISMG
ncbi:MAG: ornithine carbamoyltransferase, partial [Candidatus Rokubacteria bacterium]|nr:ornithine carbamoyltransferase [Candidatus Rokubacteria bacterium]